LRNVVKMGRPREHDEAVALALLDAAELTLQESGFEALSVRGVAEAAGTTTRAVYSVFGSKDGLLAALAVRAFALLGAAVAALPTTDEPGRDLVDAGAVVFRRFAREHPILFRLGFQARAAPAEWQTQLDQARGRAFRELLARVQRVEAAGALNGRTAIEAAGHFHALCEGLTEMEIRGGFTGRPAEAAWRDALNALVAGLAIPTPAIQTA
jgi:AcrR family transcriptional regulator